MTEATADRLANLKRGWRISLRRHGELIEGTVSDIDNTAFRLGIDPAEGEKGDGTSLLIPFEEAAGYDLEIVDTTGEIDAEVVDWIDRDGSLGLGEHFAGLTPDEPVQHAGPTSVTVERPGGYDQPDGADLDDAAMRDAAADNEAIARDPLLAVLHLPAGAAVIANIMLAIGEQCPSAYIDLTNDNPREVHIRAPREEVG